MFNFKKTINKIFIFLFLQNNITNNIFAKSAYSGKQNGYSIKNKDNKKEQDSTITSDNNIENKKEIEDDEKEKIENDKKKDIKEYDEKEKIENDEKKDIDDKNKKIEENKKKKKENEVKQKFTNRFNKIDTDLNKLINYNKNKFKISKEIILTVTLNEINKITSENIGNIEQKIVESEENFNNLIKTIVNDLSKKYEVLKEKETDTIKLDFAEIIFKDLLEVSKIIEIDSKLSNFETAINNNTDEILNGIEHIYNELFAKKDKIDQLVKDEFKFDFIKNSLDLIKKKEIKELLEIKTKLNKLKTEYENIINEKLRDSRAKYKNLSKILEEYNKLAGYSVFEIDVKDFNFDNFENNIDDINNNITNFENKLKDEFDSKLENLNTEKENIIEKLIDFGLKKEIEEFIFEENKELNKKLKKLEDFKKKLDECEKLLQTEIENKKKDCNNKLEGLKKDNDISESILASLKNDFSNIEGYIENLEDNNDYNGIINNINNLSKKIQEKDKEKKIAKIEDLSIGFNGYLKYNEFVEIFENYKKIYDKSDVEDSEMTKLLKNILKKNLSINVKDKLSSKGVLGKGGFGIVEKVEENGKFLTRKKIITEKVDSTNKLNRLESLAENEIKITTLFKNYNNILQIYDVSLGYNEKFHDYLPVIITEYYENGSLTDNLDKLNEY